MEKNNILVAPFLKWVGGKRQIMPSIVNLLPKNISERKLCNFVATNNPIN
jgi:DNA adenine methylase